MRLIHLSDLHLGKRVHEYSMLEDQAHILGQITEIIEAERPAAVLIAGDIYDKPVPSAEAVRLFDDFLCGIVRPDRHIFVISGNHDAPERLAFAARLVDSRGVHLSPVYDGRIEPVTLTDEFGPVRFWMLPFVKPAHIRRAFPDAAPETWTEALRTAVDAMGIDPAQRNVLIAHQFVTGASRSDSEEISVGGADNVDAAVFEGFDYAALGHIHNPQSLGARLRYCGTPLKYSFSEAGREKSVTVAELGEKGSLAVRTVPLVPRREMRELRGTYMELTARSFYAGTDTDAYLHITLTDEEDIPDAAAKLRIIYPNLLRLDYDNSRTRAGAALTVPAEERRSPLELFNDLYEKQNGQGMSEEQRRFAADLIERIWEDGA